MKVAIVGSGALGSLFSARLARSGVQTTLVCRDAETASRLKQTGIIVDGPDGSFTATPQVASALPAGQDLVIVLVKSYHLKDVHIPAGTRTLTLQNGLGNVETLCSMAGSAHVLAGATHESAVLEDEGHVKHICSGRTVFGSWTTCSFEEAADVLTKAGFMVEITESPGQLIWEYAAIAGGVHPLTALLGVPNGRLLDIPEVRQLMRDLVVEAVKVASTEGYRFAYSLVERAEEFCTETREVLSPMLQDVKAGGLTEIEALSGEILRRAQLAALPCPRTRVIWQLMKGIERR